MSLRLIKAGDGAFDTPTDTIMLYGTIKANGNVTHLQPAFSTDGYQVSVGKTLYMIRLLVTGQGNPAWIKLGYADNDVGIDTTTARTNPVMAIGIDGTSTDGIYVVPVNSAGPDSPEDLNIIFPLSVAGKYPFIRFVGAAPPMAFLLWAIEL